MADAEDLYANGRAGCPRENAAEHPKEGKRTLAGCLCAWPGSMPGRASRDFRPSVGGGLARQLSCEGCCVLRLHEPGEGKSKGFLAKVPYGNL